MPTSQVMMRPSARAASTALYSEVPREVETRTQLTRPPSRHRPPQQSLLLESPVQPGSSRPPSASGKPPGAYSSDSPQYVEIFTSDTDEEEL